MQSRIEELTAPEVRALAGAATWYAKYHGSIIAERLDDRSAGAVAQRERYRDLLAALEKLGIRLRDPETEAQREQAAA